MKTFLPLMQCSLKVFNPTLNIAAPISTKKKVKINIFYHNLNFSTFEFPDLRVLLVFIVRQSICGQVSHLHFPCKKSLNRREELLNVSIKRKSISPLLSPSIAFISSFSELIFSSGFWLVTFGLEPLILTSLRTLLSLLLGSSSLSPFINKIQ